VKEVVGNLWDYHKQGHWIVITTNGTIKANGEAVMGRGIALQAKRRFSWISSELGRALKGVGNTVYLAGTCRIICFPVKHNWWEAGDLSLIEESCKQLVYQRGTVLPRLMDSGWWKPIYMVRPGCGNGQLDWEDVKSILERYLDDRFVIVERQG